MKKISSTIFSEAMPYKSDLIVEITEYLDNQVETMGL